MTFTVNSTDNKDVPGGYYISIQDRSTGDKATAVYDANGDLVEFD